MNTELFPVNADDQSLHRELSCMAAKWLLNLTSVQTPKRSLVISGSFHMKSPNFGVCCCSTSLKNSHIYKSSN